MAGEDLSDLGSPAFWARLVLCTLGTWRITHLLAREDGPGDLVLKLRQRLGDSALGRAADCFHCMSLWTAMPFALWLASGWLGWIVGTLALSGAACVIEQATGSEPID